MRGEQNYMCIWKICSCTVYEGCLIKDRVCPCMENKNSQLPNYMNSDIDSVPHCFGIKGGYHS